MGQPFTHYTVNPRREIRDGIFKSTSEVIQKYKSHCSSMGPTILNNVGVFGNASIHSTKDRTGGRSQ